MNQKISRARLVPEEFEIIFLLGERGLCKVQGHAVSVGKGNPVRQRREVFCTSSYDGGYGYVICDCSVEAVPSSSVHSTLDLSLQPRGLAIEKCLRE